MIEYIKIKFVLWLYNIKISRTEYNAILENQRAKGLKKYGITLKQCQKNSYDWRKMALEEIVDFIQYVKKLNDKI